PVDADRRNVGGLWALAYRATFPVGDADRDLLRVRPWILSPARLHPASCHRSLAHRARGGDVIAFLELLSRPSRGSSDLRIWLRARRARANAVCRSTRGVLRGLSLRALACAADAGAVIRFQPRPR